MIVYRRHSDVEDINIFFFFFNDTATTEIYTLSLHDALPILLHQRARELRDLGEAKATRHHAGRVGQRADGVVSGHGAGKVEVLTQDYVSVYLPTHEWNGSARFEVTVR